MLYCSHYKYPIMLWKPHRNPIYIVGVYELLTIGEDSDRVAATRSKLGHHACATRQVEEIPLINTFWKASDTTHDK